MIKFLSNKRKLLSITLFIFASLSLILQLEVVQNDRFAKLTYWDIKLENQDSLEFGNPLYLRREVKSVRHYDLFNSSRGLEKDTTTLSQNIANTNTSGNIRRLPQVIIIGVKKCGTRALLEYLRLHPAVKAPGPEPHFFDRYYHLGMEWYRQKMPKSNETQLTVEKTPRYFITADAPARIFNMSRTVKLLLVVRDPIIRAISDFTQYMSKSHSNKSVSFKSKVLRRNGEINERWSAIKTGLYEQHLQNWLKYFPMESIHIVDGENLIKNPVQELSTVQDFLRLEHKIPEENIYMNSTRGFPCILKLEKYPPHRCFRSSKGRPHSHIDNDTLQKMRHFYKPYNDKFYQFVGRNFSW